MAASGIQCFPAELERKIFEIAIARFSKSVPHILLVARRFQEWFEPELYRIIRVDSTQSEAFPPFLCHVSVDHGRVVDTERLATYGHWVQHCLLQDCHITNLLDILKHCPNIEDVALCSIHGCTGNQESYLPVLEGLSLCKNLKKVTIVPSDFFYDPIIPFAHPAFINVTHLEILNPITYSWELWSGLSRIPGLTHLAITVDPVLLSGIVLCLLIDCRSLKFLVLVNQNMGANDPDLQLEQTWSNPAFYNLKLSESGKATFWMLDSRVILLNSSNIPLADDPMGHWEMAARGGSDFWMIAEGIQAQRAKFTKNQTLFDLVK